MAPIPAAAFCGGEAGNIVDAELTCFDAGPSPLLAVTVYDQAGGVVSGPDFYDPLTGAPTAPAGAPAPCANIGTVNASITGPVGPGDCAEAVRVVQCEPVPVDDSTPIAVTPMPEVTRGDAVNLTGAGASWDITVDPTGTGVRSVTIMRRLGGPAASVTVTTTSGAFPLGVGETITFDLTTGPLSVATTHAANDVLVLWTELP